MSHFNQWHLYAHSHGTLSPLGKSYDVGVDNNNYMPVSFDQVKEIMKKLPDNENWLRKLKDYNHDTFLAVQDQVKNGVDIE